jgi:putative transposase
MSLRAVTFLEGEYYHIYNRGNSKQKIFHDKGDYLHFIYLLYLSNTTRIFNFNREATLVSIGAYCIMPNHFHILITQKVEGGISKFMQKITTAYSMYYNKKYKRTGSLFEGKFKSRHVPTDLYLKYLFSYIHLNPLKLIDSHWKKEGVKNKKLSLEFLEKYMYSSYLDYLGTIRSENTILNKEAFPNYFPNKKKFEREVFDWLSYESTP